MIVFCFVRIKRSVESALLSADVDDELDFVDSLPDILIGFDWECGVDGCDWSELMCDWCDWCDPVDCNECCDCCWPSVIPKIKWVSYLLDLVFFFRINKVLTRWMVLSINFCRHCRLGKYRKLTVYRNISTGPSFSHRLFWTGWFQMVTRFIAVFIPTWRKFNKYHSMFFSRFGLILAFFFCFLPFFKILNLLYFERYVFIWN